MARTCFLSLRTQHGNLGDLAITAVLAGLLARKGRVFCLTDRVPPPFLRDFRRLSARLGGGALHFGTRAEALRRLPRAWAGGIAVALTPGHVASDRSAPACAALRAATRLCGQRLAIVQAGTSYAAAGANNVALLADLSRRGQPLSVRDAWSQQLLRERGIALPTVPDLAWALPGEPSGSGRRVVFVLRGRPGAGEAALAMRLEPLVAVARGRGLEPALFWQVDRDAQPGRRLAARLGLPVLNRHDARPGYDEAIAVYRASAAIVSDRLHALLLGAAAGAVPVALLKPEERKVRGVFELAGIGGLATSTAQTDEALLGDVLDRPQRYRALVADARQRMAASIDAFAATWPE